MIRISLPYIIKLSEALDALSRLPPGDETPAKDVLGTFYVAESSVQALIQNSVYAPYLRSSFELAQSLIRLLRAQLEIGSDENRKVSWYDLWLIKSKYSEYKIALLSELGVLNSFFVTQKGGFDTTTLLNWGEQLFPSDLSTKVPEALFDAREAAKCLAYEVPTSAGFHLFRVTEAVLRKYFAHVTGGAAQPKVRNIGVYLEALRRVQKGEPKVLAALKQMTDLHRNPLIHPEAVLTMDEALATAGSVRSVTTALLANMPVVLPTTSTAPTAIATS